MQVVSAITTIYDSAGQALIIDSEVDHFFIGNFYRRAVFPAGDELWIADNGVKRTLQSFIWEVWNGFVTPGHSVTLKGPDMRDYTLKNLELRKVKKQKVA